jgi:hypothetical protein
MPDHPALQVMEEVTTCVPTLKAATVAVDLSDQGGPVDSVGVATLGPGILSLFQRFNPSGRTPPAEKGSAWSGGDKYAVLVLGYGDCGVRGRGRWDRRRTVCESPAGIRRPRSRSWNEAPPYGGLRSTD